MARIWVGTWDVAVATSQLSCVQGIFWGLATASRQLSYFRDAIS